MGLRRTEWIIGFVVHCVLFQPWLCDSESQPSGGTVTPNCEEVIHCTCLDLIEVTGVQCNNVTDFAHLTEKLRDGSLYEVNETYEITLTGIQSLPARFLDGLIVFRLYVDDVMASSISDQAFDGVIRLRRLHVRASSIKALPNFTAVSHSLRNLNFDNSLLSSVRNEVQNLPLLEELTLRQNLIQNVSADALVGTTILKIVDFSENLLESLPPDLFSSLENLNKLVLSYNRLHTVHGLLRIVRPKVIYLDHNQLTDADDILHKGMTSVETIQLNNNPIRNVSTRSFNARIPNARFLYLDHCLIEEFDITHYQDLSILAVLDLSGNRIEKIPDTDIEFGKSLQLILDNNRITSFEAEIKPTMKRLYLNGNLLRFLGRTLQLTQLAEVEVNENLLEAITENDLRGMHGTENLLLRHNRIRRLDTEAFTSVRNDLQHLDLSINFITSLNGSVRYLSQLKSLNVSSNAITILKEGEFVGLNELSELYMQNNKIIALCGQIQRMPQLVYLILQNNMMTTLNMEQLPKSLRFLYFKDNPIECNCQLLPFVEWLNKDGSPKTDVTYCEPREDDQKNVGVQPIHLNLCPDPCTCYCTHDVNGSYVAVDCHYRNISQIPYIFINTDGKNNKTTATRWRPIIVGQNANPQFLLSDRILSVDLEGNDIRSLDGWSFPYNLKELWLAKNGLSTLPKSIQRLRSLRRLSLSDNPWSCVCEAVDFKRWLTSKMDSVLDVNRTRCEVNSEYPATSGKVLISLSDVDLCPVSVGLYVTVVFSVLTVLLLALVLTVMYHRYEMNIKVWLYSHGVSWVKEADLDKDKSFEAFLSFSHADEEFVTENIIAEIEERIPDIRLCIHYRNFLPGEFIHTNIMNAVQASKRTVIILTKNFFESEWCLWEFRAAHLQAMEDKVVRIIVIKVGELPEDIDPSIKVYLKSTTYVTWGEKYFWQKLLYCLPEASKRHFNDGSTEKLVEMN